MTAEDGRKIQVSPDVVAKAVNDDKAALKTALKTASKTVSKTVSEPASKTVFKTVPKPARTSNLNSKYCNTQYKNSFYLYCLIQKKHEDEKSEKHKSADDTETPEGGAKNDDMDTERGDEMEADTFELDLSLDEIMTAEDGGKIEVSPDVVAKAVNDDKAALKSVPKLVFKPVSKPASETVPNPVSKPASDDTGAESGVDPMEGDEIGEGDEMGEGGVRIEDLEVIMLEEIVLRINDEEQPSQCISIAEIATEVGRIQLPQMKMLDSNVLAMKSVQSKYFAPKTRGRRKKRRYGHRTW
jgi:hypothetical protein